MPIEGLVGEDDGMPDEEGLLALAAPGIVP